MKRFTKSQEMLKPDPKYHSIVLAKFINSIMWDGKKTTAQRIVYDAMEVIKERVGDEEPIKVFETAIENVKPIMEVRSKRVGGATYQVPMEVGAKRRQTLAFRWIIAAARGRKGKPMHLKLADELLAAYRREGTAYTQRENTHKMAEANKAFAHFAW